jgi:uncharacterized protein
MKLDRDEIVGLTRQYGGEWGVRHTERLLRLIALIVEGEDYDHEALWLAAYMHDWGSYEAWARPDTDHAARSAEITDEFLRARGFPEPQLMLVLKAIRTHHKADRGSGAEARLLSDADALDLLGATGVVRAFSMAGCDLRSAYDAAQKRRELVPGRLCSERAKTIAEARLRVMGEVLAAFEADSFGLF